MNLLEQIAQQRTNETIYTAISATIETLARELARDILKDPGFRAEMKALARQSFGTGLRQLRSKAPAKRKKKARRA